jgi:quercetin dioxygenase-like cupin family protein
MKLLTQIERTAASDWFADELVTAAHERTPSRAQTALVERSAPQGAMPPLHRRDEDETYRVLEGEVTFFVDDDVVPARPGDVVVAPAGAARTFIATEDARWLVLTHVSSIDRFVAWGRAIARPVSVALSRCWPSASEHSSLIGLAAGCGIEVIAPPGVLP